MGRLILCYSKKANRPYYIKNMNLNLYTIEELCYYLYNNIYLIDENVINDDLIKWIDKELELTDLSEALSNNRGSIKKIMMIILDYTGYVSNEDMEETGKLLTKIDGQSSIEKRMARATHLLQCKKYVEAILEYKILYELDDGNLREELLNNMGVSYAGMFLFNEAAKCFKEAYELSRNQVIYKHLLYAVAMSPKEEVLDNLKEYVNVDYEKILNKELENVLTSDTNQKLKQYNTVLNYKKDNQIAMYYQGLESLLSEWKKEYTKYTQ
jgi:tetratricopeptide (TPR) repeat protein